MPVMTIYNGDKQHYDFFYGPKSFVTVRAGSSAVVPGVTSAAQAASIAAPHAMVLKTANTAGAGKTYSFG